MLSFDFRHLLESTCDRVMDRPRHRLDKVSKLPAVEVPDPGQSYNPTFADHQNLMLKAHLIEAEKEEAKAKINRKVEDMIKNVAGLPTEVGFSFLISVLLELVKYSVGKINRAGRINTKVEDMIKNVAGLPTEVGFLF